MNGRPELLLLCHTLPYPPDGGVWIRTYHVIRLLARSFDLTILCFERTGAASADRAGDRERALEALGRFGAIEVFAIPQARSRLRFAWDHLRSLLRGRVYTRYLYECRAFRRRLREILADRRFALIHVDSLDLAGYLPMCARHPVVCVHHNIESVLLRRRAEIEEGALRRRYLQLQARLQEREERRWGGRVDLNVVVSSDDAETLARLCPDARLAVVPNGVDVEAFRPEEGAAQGIVYIGGAHWFPNLDALEYFCEEILPHLRSAGAHLPIRWVGSASEEQRRYFGSRHGVELTGYVADVRPYLRDCLCSVVPLRAGGGTRLKILDAWAMGRAVVTTSVGCEGLAAVDGDNALVRDDAKSFADAILLLARDPDRRRRMERSARQTAERLYSWEVIGRGMVETYRQLASGATG